MQTQVLYIENAPEDVYAAVRELRVDAELRTLFTDTPDPSATHVTLCRAESSQRKGYVVQPAGVNQVVVLYARICDALRALGRLMRAYGASADARFSEESTFDDVGIMIDCSRNGVMRPHVVQWLARRLALGGYNQIMLYTEETYAVPKHPFFGYMRGRYAPYEVQAVDATCVRLGIDLVPCIQTLGHLSQALQWPAMDRYRDQQDVLLCDYQETYDLIDDMLQSVRNMFSSRRVHIGMDEAFGLGLGRYARIHGECPAYEIFVRHLQRVVRLCQKYGMRPMMWSDMFFNMAPNSRGYYDIESTIPEFVKRLVPDLDIVYWDYYHSKSMFYETMIDRHTDLISFPVADDPHQAAAAAAAASSSRREPSHAMVDDAGTDDMRADDSDTDLRSALSDGTGTMRSARSANSSFSADEQRNVVCAGGVWTWNRLWAALPFSYDTTRALMQAAKVKNVRQVIVTLWGDDGAECDYLSSLPGLALFAELAYAEGHAVSVSEHSLFHLWTRCDVTHFVRASYLDARPGKHPMWGNPSKFVLWEDPMYGLGSCHIEDIGAQSRHWAQLAEELRVAAQQARGDFGARLLFPAQIALVCSLKVRLRPELATAYRERDVEAIIRVAADLLHPLIIEFEKLLGMHRSLWLSMFKPFGLEVLEHKYSGGLSRLKHLAQRVDGVVAALRAHDAASAGTLEELDETPLPVMFEQLEHIALCYSRVATGCATYVTGESWRG